MTDNPILTIGAPAPDFKLTSNLGTDTSLADFRGKKNIYLFFVREFN